MTFGPRLKAGQKLYGVRLVLEVPANVSKEIIARRRPASERKLTSEPAMGSEGDGRLGDAKTDR